MFRRSKNIKRKIFRKKVGFVHFVIKGKIASIIEPRSFIEKQIKKDPILNLISLRKNFSNLINNNSVKGIIIHLNIFEINGQADLFEMRQLIKMWKDANKPVWVYANNLNLRDYYMISPADKIFVIPGGILNAVGLHSSVEYYKKYLNKQGIEVQVAQISPYKSAANFISRDEMPDEEREMINWLMGSVFETLVSGIAESRDKTVEEVKKMINDCPKNATLSTEEGWIDGVIGHEQVMEKLMAEYNLKKKDISNYFDALGKISISKRGKNRVAVIPAIGNIIDGESKNSPFPIPIFGGKSIGDISIVQTIRKIRKNRKKFSATILFVDSGGGSAVSSESMLTELGELAKEMPLYVYFHNVAASGGYYIAMNARKIFASPMTITGSIGVINLKFINKEFYDKKNITRYEFSFGENANMGSGTQRWTEKQEKIVNREIWSIYDTFINHVSKNRSLTYDEVLNLAGGRVWTGRQAKDHKLLDEIIGLGNTIDYIKKELNLKSIHLNIFSSKGDLIAPNPSDIGVEILRKLVKFSGRNMMIYPNKIEFNY